MWNHNTPKWKLAEIYSDSPKPASLMFIRVGLGPEWKHWFIELLWLRNLQATEKCFPLGIPNPGLLSPSTSTLTQSWGPFSFPKICEHARLNAAHPNEPLAASGEGSHPGCPGRGSSSSLGGTEIPSAGDPLPFNNLHILQISAALGSNGSRWEHGGCLEK